MAPFYVMAPSDSECLRVYHTYHTSKSASTSSIGPPGGIAIPSTPALPSWAQPPIPPVGATGPSGASTSSISSTSLSMTSPITGTTSSYVPHAWSTSTSTSTQSTPTMTTPYVQASVANVGANFLDTLAQTHEWPLGAFGELIHNSVDAEAKNIWIGEASDVGTSGVLEVRDDGIGMTHAELKKMLTIGNSASEAVFAEGRIGGYGIGFKSGSSRLGQLTVVITKSSKANTISIGIIGKACRDENHNLLTPVITFDNSTLEPDIRVDPIQQHQYNLQLIQKHVPYLNDMRIGRLTADISRTNGTKILINHVVHDIKLMPQMKDIQLEEGKEYRRPTSSQQALEIPHEYSLRKYCELMFYDLRRTKMHIYGSPIIHKPFVDRLTNVKSYQFHINAMRPEDDHLDAKVYIGESKEYDALHLGGVMVFWNGVLVVSFLRVGDARTRPDPFARGIVGCVDLPPKPLLPHNNKVQLNPANIYYKPFMNELARVFNDHVGRIEASRAIAKKEADARAIAAARRAPPPAVARSKELSWVQCSSCEKWRILPEPLKDDKADWFCKDHPDPAKARLGCEPISDADLVDLTQFEVKDERVHGHSILPKQTSTFTPLKTISSSSSSSSSSSPSTSPKSQVPQKGKAIPLPPRKTSTSSTSSSHPVSPSSTYVPLSSSSFNSYRPSAPSITLPSAASTSSRPSGSGSSTPTTPTSTSTSPKTSTSAASSKTTTSTSTATSTSTSTSSKLKLSTTASQVNIKIRPPTQPLRSILKKPASPAPSAEPSSPTTSSTTETTPPARVSTPTSTTASASAPATGPSAASASPPASTSASAPGRAAAASPSPSPSVAPIFTAAASGKNVAPSTTSSTSSRKRLRTASSKPAASSNVPILNVIKSAPVANNMSDSDSDSDDEPIMLGVKRQKPDS